MLSRYDDRVVASVSIIRPDEVPVSVLIIGNREQVVAQSLVIEHKHGPLCAAQGHCTFGQYDVDRVVELVKHDKKNGHVGFSRAISSGGNSSNLN